MGPERGGPSVDLEAGNWHRDLPSKGARKHGRRRVSWPRTGTERAPLNPWQGPSDIHWADSKLRKDPACRPAIAAPARKGSVYRPLCVVLMQGGRLSIARTR